MTQAERRLFLINELIKEDKGQNAEYLGLTPGNSGGYVIPEDTESQQNILRALMNMRPPYEASEEFFKIQDEYLQQRNMERGFTDVNDLTPCKTHEQLYLWKGDITTLKIDAIVNAANNRLLGCWAPLHACIDNCIHTFAGIQLRLACNQIMVKQNHPEGTGLAKITPAFNLPSKYVLHTVGPIITARVTERDKAFLKSCYTSCLETAASHCLESVAFCCISTGVFRFPADLASQIATETVTQWLKENSSSSVKKVVFNVFGQKDFDLYNEILNP